MQSALYRPHRNVKLPGDLGLGQFFPKIKVQDLLIFIATKVKGFSYGSDCRKAVSAVGEFPICDLIKWNFILGRIFSILIHKFICSDVDHTRFERYPVF